MIAEADVRFSAQQSQAEGHNGYAESTNPNGSEAGMRRAALRQCAACARESIPVPGGAVAANILVSYHAFFPTISTITRFCLPGAVNASGLEGSFPLGWRWVSSDITGGGVKEGM